MKRIAYSLIALAIAAFTFTSCEDVPSPFGTITDPDNGNGQETVDPAGDGTAANPYNVAGVLEYIGTLGSETSDKDVYVKGIIVEVKEAFGKEYGNATFTMADTESSKQTFTFYRGLYLGNVKYTDEKATNIKVGDRVVVCGKVMMYGGNTPETSQGNAYVVSINDEGGDTPTPQPSGETLGTKDSPLSITQALDEINKLGDGKESDQYAFVKGKVVKVTTNQTNFDKYGNLNYLISEDGTDNGKTITVYSGDGLDGAKFTGINDLAQGDEVIVYGKLYKYVNANTGAVTPEIAKGNYLVSLIKGDTPTPQPGGDVKIVTVAEFNAAPESTDVWYQITGTVKNLKDNDQYGNFDLEDETGSVYVYGLLSEKGGEKKKFQELVAAKGIKNGSKITIIGNRGSFNDKIEVLNAYFVSIEEAGGGGETSGTGTLQSPLTASQAYDAVAALAADVTSTEDYYVKGKICSIKYTYSANFGTATFNISDNGATGGKEFTVYGTYYKADGQKWKEGDTQITEGDEVVVCGKVINYQGNTPEFANKKNYVVTINGN